MLSQLLGRGANVRVEVPIPASKATGYPIAHVAAKLVLGRSLVDLRNPLTGTTSALFEPSLDYLAIKIPRWDLNKFDGVSPLLGSTMKSVGEVMAIGKNFPETIQKAVRMVMESPLGLGADQLAELELEELLHLIEHPTDERLFALVEALRRGVGIRQLHSVSGIDLWFLNQLKSIVETEREITRCFDESRAPLKEVLHGLEAAEFKKWKKRGFSDAQIARQFRRQRDCAETVDALSDQVRQCRIDRLVLPCVKKIDTTSGEHPSPSNYLYFTYEGEQHDYDRPREEERSVIVVGGGSYRIGTSVEFDWCAVSCSKVIRAEKISSILVNCNPETVSTDYDSSDRLYFEELTVERIRDIADLENCQQVIVSMGGQVANSMAGKLADCGFSLLGHSAETIENAENRFAFSSLLDELGIAQPRWTVSHSLQESQEFATELKLPILVRPSYVLSGSAMKVIDDRDELGTHLKRCHRISQGHPVLISEFVSGAKELEFDGVAQNGQLLISVLSEHVEHAGVHSGDATVIVPAQTLAEELSQAIKAASAAIAEKLGLHGPFNIQYLVKDDQFKVIECNVRAARSFPFVSKTLGVNFAEVATKVALGTNLSTKELAPELPAHVGVKAATFSFSRLKGADPVTSVEMAATGEVGCIGKSLEQALCLALEASGTKEPKRGILLHVQTENADRESLDETLKLLSTLGLTIYLSQDTASCLERSGLELGRIQVLQDGQSAEMDVIEKGLVDFAFVAQRSASSGNYDRDKTLRQAAVRNACSLITDMQKLRAFALAMNWKRRKAADAELLSLPPYRSENSLSSRM